MRSGPSRVRSGPRGQWTTSAHGALAAWTGLHPRRRRHGKDRRSPTHRLRRHTGVSAPAGDRRDVTARAAGEVRAAGAPTAGGPGAHFPPHDAPAAGLRPAGVGGRCIAARTTETVATAAAARGCRPPRQPERPRREIEWAKTTLATRRINGRAKAAAGPPFDVWTAVAAYTHTSRQERDGALDFETSGFVTLRAEEPPLSGSARAVPPFVVDEYQDVNPLARMLEQARAVPRSAYAVTRNRHLLLHRGDHEYMIGFADPTAMPRWSSRA